MKKQKITPKKLPQTMAVQQTINHRQPQSILPTVATTSAAPISKTPKNPNTHIAIPTYNADGTIQTKDQAYAIWLKWRIRECTYYKQLEARPSEWLLAWHDFVWALTGYNVPNKEFDFQRDRRRRQEELDYLEAHGPI